MIGDPGEGRTAIILEPAQSPEIAPLIVAAHGLTAREREVAALIARGQSNREIANTLILGERTIETHVSHVLNKLGVNSRREIARWAVDHGLTSG